MSELYNRLQVLEGDTPLSPEERLRAAVRPLLSWYGENARTLPWRESPKPYSVWVSEIMLQQTRVEAVKPYFERFMRELPTVKDLAEAEDDRLMKLWEGLGYYSRARNLKKAAAVACERYGGELPADYGELLKLPGIGSYTAGAIASIAFGIPEPAVDGNVLRVLSRVLASREDISRQAVKRGMEELVRGVIPPDRAGDFNQALIEVGALVCIPGGEPKCAGCPFHSLCLARRRGLTGEIPVKAPKKARRIERRTIVLLETETQVAIRRRPEEGLLASLWEFPSLEGDLGAEEAREALGIPPELFAGAEELPEAKHIFSHVDWHMRGIRIRLTAPVQAPADGGMGELICADKGELWTRYPLPGAFAAYRRLV